MKQYIDKSALVEELKKLKMDIGNIFNEYDEGFWEGRTTAFDDVICALNTLEVKEIQEEPESIWHDAKEPPEMYRKYFARYSDGRINGFWERHDDGFIPWKDVVKEHNITHWCYVEDLLKL